MFVKATVETATGEEHGLGGYVVAVVVAESESSHGSIGEIDIPDADAATALGLQLIEAGIKLRLLEKELRAGVDG